MDEYLKCHLKYGGVFFFGLRRICRMYIDLDVLLVVWFLFGG